MGRTWRYSLAQLTSSKTDTRGPVTRSFCPSFRVPSRVSGSWPDPTGVINLGGSVRFPLLKPSTLFRTRILGQNPVPNCPTSQPREPRIGLGRRQPQLRGAAGDTVWTGQRTSSSPARTGNGRGCHTHSTGTELSGPRFASLCSRARHRQQACLTSIRVYNGAGIAAHLLCSPFSRHPRVVSNHQVWGHADAIHEENVAQDTN